MASSSKAKSVSDKLYSKRMNALSDKYDKEYNAIEKKYADRGVTGSRQARKEQDELIKKYKKLEMSLINSSVDDDMNIWRYGKDAMKGKGFMRYAKGGSVAKGKKPNAGMKALKEASPATAKKMGYKKGGATKKMGYSHGGMVKSNCGASMKATQSSSSKKK